MINLLVENVYHIYIYIYIHVDVVYFKMHNLCFVSKSGEQCLFYTHESAFNSAIFAGITVRQTFSNNIRL